jgi:hypothetical protein
VVAISFFGRDARQIRERLIPHLSRYCKLSPTSLAVFLCLARRGRARLFRPCALRAADVFIRPPGFVAAVVVRACLWRGRTVRVLAALIDSEYFLRARHRPRVELSLSVPACGGAARSFLWRRDPRTLIHASSAHGHICVQRVPRFRNLVLFVIPLIRRE